MALMRPVANCDVEHKFEYGNATNANLPVPLFFWLPCNEKERIKVWLAKVRLVYPPAKTARICQAF